MKAVLHCARGISVDRQSAAYILAAVGAGILIGLTVATISLMDSQALIPVGIAALGSLVALRRRWLMSTAVSLMFVNPGLLPPLAEAQGFTIRIIDAVAILLAAHVVLRILFGVRRRELTVSGGRIFGLTAAFLAYIGLTLMIPLYLYPEHFPVAAISYVRLVSSFALGIMIYLLLRHSEDFSWIRRIIIAAAFMNGLVAIFQWIRFGAEFLFHPSLRVDGLLGPNGLGFVGSMLLVLSLSARSDTAARRQRWAEKVGVSLGLLMLFLAKSASAIVAAGVGVALFLFLTRSPRLTGKRLITSILALAGGLAAILAFRWPDIVGLLKLSGGSFAHRLVVGYAAWLVFLQHPLFGVGWQTSWAPDVIANPDVSAQVRLHLGRLPTVLLPEENPTSVHNFYLQLLAELGVVGVALFAILVIVLIGECRKLLQSTSPAVRAVAIHWTVILVMLAIWLNTNPLFGGQMAAYVLFLAFAAIGAASRLPRDWSLGQPASTGHHTY